MPARHGEHDLVAEERLEDDAAVPPRGADDAELELAPRDLLDHALRVRHRQRDVHARVQPLELAEHDRAAPSRPGPVEAPISSRPRQLALGLLAELGEQLLLEREQPLRAPVEAPARPRSARRAGRSGRAAAAPSRFSSERICRLTAGCVTPSCSAAWEKLRRSTTAQNAAS